MWDEIPFIGRGEELAALERTLAGLPAAKASLALLGGPAGIGKSRILDEFAGLAERAGVRVWLGRAREDVRPPFGPLVEALREHREALLSRAGENASLLQAFLRSRGPAPHPVERQEGERHALFLALSDALLAAARDRPTVLLLDDLHWFDPDSIDLFEHLAFAALHPRCEARLAIVATHRDGEPGTRFERALARLSREARCQRFGLDGFDEAETRELIQAVGETRPANQLVARLSQETGGNPLFLREIVRHLVRAGELERRGGYLTMASGGAEVSLPADVTAAIAVRVSALTAPSRGVLVTAALLGQEFSLAALAGLLEQPELGLLERLEEAEAAGLVESRGQSYRFAHPVVRYVCAKQSSRARRERMHADLARRLESRPDAQEGAAVFAVAHHWLAAGAAGEPTTRLTWARRAAERAVALVAWAEAARFFEAAAEAAADCAGVSERERAQLHYQAGYYFHRDWDAGPCVDHYGRALALFRHVGDTAGAVLALKERIRASLTLAAPGLDAAADAEALERELEILREREPRVRARALDALATHYWATRGGAQKATELAHEAMAIARAENDPGLASELAGVVALVQLADLDVEGALQSWLRGAEDARSTGDLHRTAQAAYRVPMAELQLGRLERARTAVRAARELDRGLRNPEVSLALAAEATEACLRGDLDAAEASASESLRLIQRSGYLWPRAAALGALACARAWRGDFPGARDAVALLTDPAMGEAEVRRQRRAALIFARLVDALELGPAAPGLAGADHPVLAARAGRYDVALIPSFCAQVDCAVMTARPPLAVGLGAPLALACERGIVFSLGWAFLVPRVLGLASALDGGAGESRERLQRARELAERSGAHAEHARATLDLARVTLDADAAAARALFREAADEIRELGLWGLRRLARELGAELGETAQLAELDRPVDTVTSEERSLLAQLALGRSDAEIADDLLLGADTVAGRRDLALARIGATSRAEATAWAVERGVGDAAEQVRTTLEAFIGPTAERGALVIAVTDISGSTALAERVGDSALRELLRGHNRRVRASLRVHGGIEVQHTGDGFIVAFREPAAAIAWAGELRGAFARSRLRVRIGLHAGHALPEEDRLVGLEMNTTARICSTAKPGEVLVSENFRRLLGRGRARFGRPRRVNLKGRSDRIALYALNH